MQTKSTARHLKASNTDSKFPFLKLPPEIRNKIYEILIPIDHENERGIWGYDKIRGEPRLQRHYTERDPTAADWPLNRYKPFNWANEEKRITKHEVKYRVKPFIWLVNRQIRKESKSFYFNEKLCFDLRTEGCLKEFWSWLSNPYFTHGDLAQIRNLQVFVPSCHVRLSLSHDVEGTCRPNFQLSVVDGGKAVEIRTAVKLEDLDIRNLRMYTEEMLGISCASHVDGHDLTRIASHLADSRKRGSEKWHRRVAGWGHGVENYRCGSSNASVREWHFEGQAQEQSQARPFADFDYVAVVVEIPETFGNGNESSEAEFRRLCLMAIRQGWEDY